MISRIIWLLAIFISNLFSMLLLVWHADLPLTESLFISVKFFYTSKYKIINFELTDFISIFYLFYHNIIEDLENTNTKLVD
jgi:hypothetical protein